MDYTLVDFLVGQGAYLECTNPQRNTALHLAAVKVTFIVGDPFHFFSSLPPFLHTPTMISSCNHHYHIHLCSSSSSSKCHYDKYHYKCHALIDDYLVGATVIFTLSLALCVCVCLCHSSSSSSSSFSSYSSSRWATCYPSILLPMMTIIVIMVVTMWPKSTR